VFRRPRSSDIPRLVEIERTAFAEGFYRPHRLGAGDFSALLARKETFFVIAANKNRVVGGLIGDLPRPSSRRHARLDSIAVDPRWQHHNVGRRLARRFIATARRAGYSAVVLEVAVPNLRAQRLFGDLGFVKARRLPKYYNGRVDAVRLVRRLA
jgi:[ribosomal protein S18]-alanine N-acetyltransferase